jgi:hypothetical protein
VAAPESIQRWQRVLADMEQLSTMPSGQQMRQQLGSPQVRANARPGGPLHQFFYGLITRAVTTPFLQLWSTDQPSDPSLLAVLQPVADAVAAVNPNMEVLPQWDSITAVVQAARHSLDTEPMGKPTVDEIVADIMSSLRTTLLISCIGQQGSIRLITEELVRHVGSFTKQTTAPLRYYDIPTKAFVDKESPTTLSLAGFKYHANRDNPTVDSDIRLLPESPPAVAKQFAAQSIVSFFTDWDEHYRPALAEAHDCSPGDFQIDYFGDLKSMRHDYVHNRGICKTSARNQQLRWFPKGDLMIPTPQNFVELITAFPAHDLRQKPSPRERGAARLSIGASASFVREFENLAGQSDDSPSDALEAALSEWINRNRTN